jgi:MYXO-CTERM domain-containing protein
VVPSEQPARRGVPVSTWILILGLGLGVVGIVAMLRRRRVDESISIRDTTRSVPTGTTIAHRP